ncbi:MAG: hypothetical protein NZ899_13950 [Thermoguttaceae bacterium]|nr:hypothetical protein [Thermoguttaceae bacterium]MDW8080139.1 hypothetical protein [Thermoguttaceae bacterium]
MGARRFLPPLTGGPAVPYSHVIPVEIPPLAWGSSASRNGGDIVIRIADT